MPLDEALAHCVVDLAGRPYVVHAGEPEGQQYAMIGGSGVPYAGSMTRHVIESFALNAQICLHLRVLAGRDPHHIVEAQFKALARAPGGPSQRCLGGVLARCCWQQSVW